MLTWTPQKKVCEREPIAQCLQLLWLLGYSFNQSLIHVFLPDKRQTARGDYREVRHMLRCDAGDLAVPEFPGFLYLLAVPKWSKSRSVAHTAAQTHIANVNETLQGSAGNICLTGDSKKHRSSWDDNMSPQRWRANEDASTVFRRLHYGSSEKVMCWHMQMRA